MLSIGKKCANLFVKMGEKEKFFQVHTNIFIENFPSIKKKQMLRQALKPTHHTRI